MLRGVLWLAGLQALQPPCKAIRGDPHPTSGLASRPSAGKRAEREPGSPARWLWACEPPTNQIPSTSRGPQLGVRRSAARGQGGPGPGRGRGLLGTRALPRSAGPASADPAPPYQVCPCGRLVGDVAARRAPPVPRPLPRPFRRAASRRHGCPRWCRRCRRESALRRVLASGDPTAGRRPGQGAGRYAFQFWKPLEQVITETTKKISTPSLSSYYKGGFEQKMSRREASLILGISPSAGKAKIRTAHRRIMILNHPDKGFGKKSLIKPS
uniref:DnaJ heat shock protein family (Hsp40) member C15 n=1 Tax=Canis lupus familiaris TaxID=9615 RepID=A0A8C0Z0F1_CANLF